MKNIIKFLLITIFILFIIKLCLIINNKEYYIDKLNSITNKYIYGSSAPRGRILDINGKVLVDNKGINTIYYNKVKNISVEEEINIAKKLADILDINLASNDELINYYLVTNNNGEDLITDEEYKLLEERKITKEKIEQLKKERIDLDKINYSEYDKKVAHIYSLMNTGVVYSKKVIKSSVEEEEFAKVMESNISGVTGELSWERIYPYKDTLKNILGTIGSIPKENKKQYLDMGYELSDIVGLSYLELEYEEYLKGEKAIYKVNSDYTLELVKKEKRGNDLVLSIDIDLQISVDNILKDKLLLAKNYQNTEYFKESYALVGDPLTGEIKAMSAIRLNDDLTFSDISLNNVNKSFTIGSAVKGATIAVGYKYNLIDKNSYITDSCVKLYYIPKKCSHKSLGKINDLKALAYSSNYYQYLIAINLTGNTYTPNMKLNANINHFNIYRSTLADFGLGVKTQIDLPNEQIGIIGNIVSDDLLLNLSIGQYDTYTPVEVLQYINSIASEKRIKLSLMKRIINNDNIIKENSVEVLNEIDLDKEDFNRIKEGLKLVLSEGTGKIYVPSGMDFAGKTGTSESFLDIDNDNIVDVATISSTFAGYYPTDNPKYSIVVITPNISRKQGSTSQFYYGASKITKDIVTYLESN